MSIFFSSELLEVAAEAFQNRQNLLMDIIDRRAISDNKPNPRFPMGLATVLSWCKCGRCREMPTQKELKCYNKHIYMPDTQPDILQNWL